MSEIRNAYMDPPSDFVYAQYFKPERIPNDFPKREEPSGLHRVRLQPTDPGYRAVHQAEPLEEVPLLPDVRSGR